MPQPMLNVEMPLSREMQELTGVERYVFDFLYPEQHLVIEYDGGYHWNGENRLDDNLRELIINSFGYRVVRVDKHQLESRQAMDLAVKEIAKHLGIRWRKPSDAVVRKREALQAALLEYDRNVYDI